MEKTNIPMNVLKHIASLQIQGKNDHHQDILKIMAGDTETINLWSGPLTPQERTDRNNAIFDHWLAGEDESHIAIISKITRRQIHNIIEYGKKARRDSISISEQPPIYNVWNYGNCNPRFGKEYPGRIPGQAIINLILWLTEPFDIVVDPMAGSGTTIDVCRYLLRRYYCYDISPSRPDIKKHDIKAGYPGLPHKPDLIILDPPYWRLKRSEYSQDGSAMTSYREWLEFMRKLARDSFKILRANGYTALFVESFLDETETGEFLFLNRDCLIMFESAGFKGIQEISLNMSSQIKTFRDVTYAKNKGILLDLKREIFVFRKP